MPKLLIFLSLFVFASFAIAEEQLKNQSGKANKKKDADSGMYSTMEECILAVGKMDYLNDLQRWRMQSKVCGKLPSSERARKKTEAANGTKKQGITLTFE